MNKPKRTDRMKAKEYVGHFVKDKDVAKVLLAVLEEIEILKYQVDKLDTRTASSQRIG